MSLILHWKLNQGLIDVERDSDAAQPINKQVAKLTKSDKIEQIKIQLLEMLSKL